MAFLSWTILLCTVGALIGARWEGVGAGTLVWLECVGDVLCWLGALDRCWSAGFGLGVWALVGGLGATGGGSGMVLSSSWSGMGRSSSPSKGGGEEWGGGESESVPGFKSPRSCDRIFSRSNPIRSDPCQIPFRIALDDNSAPVDHLRSAVASWRCRSPVAISALAREGFWENFNCSISVMTVSSLWSHDWDAGTKLPSRLISYGSLVSKILTAVNS